MSGSFHYQGQVQAEFRAVAQIFAEQLQQQRGGGAALCIYHRGRCVLDIWGGYRDRAGTPWTADTLALSFSTTKGVLATVLHILASRGLLDYDAAVADYWPEFAAKGKACITVRQLLCHEAGLYPLRPLLADAAEMCDWPHMLRVMEQAQPVHQPGRQNGYHALTFGWLVGGLLEKITGKSLAQLLDEELTQPLALDGCFIGVPEAELSRCADLLLPGAQARRETSTAIPARRKKSLPLPQQIVDRALRLSGFDPDSTFQAMVPKGMGRFDWNTQAVRQACIPGAGGLFTARSLARIYAALAQGGVLDGVPVLAPSTLAQMTQLQSTGRGAVIPLPMRWRLGYHRVFTTGPRTPQAFGHFGYGGSGAWCDPSRELALGYVVNQGAGTPFGDLRLWRLNTAAIRVVDSLPQLLWQWLRA